MALMFERLAHNYSKNGYFPTDNETLSRVLSALAPAESGAMRILDPCCGTGVALAECKQHLSNDDTTSYGIEYDEERAWQAKSVLDRCLHGDLQSCVMGQRRFGLLFLNPPYGDLVSDKGHTGDVIQQGRQRLEKLFYSYSVSTLQWGGVLVLIIPAYSLDKELSTLISNHFTRVQVFAAPEQQFKQVVIFGIRKRSESMNPETVACRELLLKAGQGEPLPVLPTSWQETPYTVPAAIGDDVKFYATSLDARQLDEEIKRFPCLWPQFTARFGQSTQPISRPLMALSNWHLALALAAGQVAGLVTASDGRRYVIKGDTYKDKSCKKTYERTAHDTVIEVTTYLDKFIAVIRALDMTPHSSHYGEVLTIQ